MIFSWQSRPATSADDGTGFFAVVGGYDVIVRDAVGAPVTGGMFVAGSKDELATTVTAMLERFEVRWLALTEDERREAYRIAAQTATDLGWTLSKELADDEADSLGDDGPE